MTYTIKLDNARQVSTLLDALNAQEIILERAMEHLNGRAAQQTLRDEVERVKQLRAQLLHTNADSADPHARCIPGGTCVTGPARLCDRTMAL